MPEGRVVVFAWVDQAAGDQSGGADEVTLPPNGRLDFILTVRPQPSVLRVAPATVESVGADGRSLKFSLRLIHYAGGPLVRAGDGASGDPSPLPNQPVTFFPVENPVFTADGPTLFRMIDSLEELHGGRSPLYAALDATLDFVQTNASAGTRTVVVVLTAAADDTCGSAAQCGVAREAVIAKAQANRIAIVTIGVAGPTGQPDRRALSQLAEGSRGAALWAEDQSQLGSLFRRTRRRAGR